MIFKSFLSPVTKCHVEKRILKTHPLHLFRIIQDVDAYSVFLPLCSHSKVLRRSPDGRCFEATLTVGLPPLFQETYVSKVHVDPDQLIVDARSVQSNLFDSLGSRWKLSEVKDENLRKQCHVDFQVEITVSDPLIVGTLDQVLREVAGRQIAAFQKRCREVPMPSDLESDESLEK